MDYTISFDIFIDDDRRYSDKEIEEFLSECLDSAAISIENVKVIDGSKEEVK